MPLNIDDGAGAQALDQQQDIDRWTNSVVSGCLVSPGTNDLTVECEAGEAIVEGERGSVPAQDNVDLATPDPDYPRKDTVYLDSTYTLVVEKGTPEPAKPGDQTRFQTNRPAPPPVSAGTVLAEVWVPPAATDITTDDVRNRRLDADLTGDEIRSVTEPVVDVKAYGAEGDGVADDTQALADADAACPADGEIWFPPGDYAISSQVQFDTNGVTITGPATIVADAVIDNPMFRVLGDDAVVQDLEFDGQNNARIGMWSGGHRHTIERCAARNFTHDTNAVYGFGTGNDDVTYRDCEVYDCDSASTGVIVRGFRGSNTAARLKIIDCHVERIGAVDDADGVKAGGVETEVRQCYFEDCEKRAIKIDNNADRSEVVGNNCYWTTGTGGMLAPRRAGIQIQTSAETVRGNYVEADNFNTGAGILDYPSGGSTITGNTVVVRDGSTADGDTTDGIEVDGASVVTNNRVDTGVDARSGIRIRYTAGNNTITGNEIYGSGPIGVSIQESGGTAPSLISITGGVIRGVAEGIKIQDGTDIVITGMAISATTADITDPNAAATTGTNV